MKATGRLIITTDGYVLAEMQDGGFSDGDMSFDSERDLPPYEEYDSQYPGYEDYRADEVMRLAEKYY